MMMTSLERVRETQEKIRERVRERNKEERVVGEVGRRREGESDK
jgi:hypothetical protein